jgi:hypothetical protein
VPSDPTPIMPRMSPRKEALASALAVGALALGGAGAASAQTSEEDTRTLNGSEQTLPFTGAEPGLVAGAGLLLAAAGIAARRRLRAARA